jgi:hypothetical protein
MVSKLDDANSNICHKPAVFVNVASEHDDVALLENKRVQRSGWVVVHL